MKKMKYDYQDCTREIKEFASSFKNAGMFAIGSSVMEKKIFCITYGKGEKKLFLNGAHHGLEYITSAFLMKFLTQYAYSVENGEDMYGFDTMSLYNKVKLFVVPMVNPDGVDIAINGLDITNRYHRRLISMVGVHSFNRVWQANVNGVDINHNYDANWDVVKKMPGPSKYAGPYAESEPETAAIVDLVRCEDFDMLMAFHSQGEEIYYDFDSYRPDGAKELALKMAGVSNYKAKQPEGSASFGGLKDWFIKEYNKRGFTVEMGKGKNPLGRECLDQFYEENAKIVLTAMEELKKES